MAKSIKIKASVCTGVEQCFGTPSSVCFIWCPELYVTACNNPFVSVKLLTAIAIKILTRSFGVLVYQCK